MYSFLDSNTLCLVFVLVLVKIGSGLTVNRARQPLRSPDRRSDVRDRQGTTFGSPSSLLKAWAHEMCVPRARVATQIATSERSRGGARTVAGPLVRPMGVESVGERTKSTASATKKLDAQSFGGVGVRRATEGSRGALRKTRLAFGTTCVCRTEERVCTRARASRARPHRTS